MKRPPPSQEHRDYIQQLLDDSAASQVALDQVVAAALREEELLTQQLYAKTEAAKWSDRLADRVASFGGSWRFIILFFLAMAVWMGINSWVLASGAFDPYPFILLNLVLSCLAAIQAPIIMMSQNRKEARDRQRAENDYLVNLKAEVEIRNLHQKLDMLMIKQMKQLFEIQARQLELLEQLRKEK